MDRTGCPPPSHRTSLGFLSQERKFSKQRFKRRNRPVCRVLVRKDHTISRVRGAQPPSHRTSLEPESGTGIFTAEIEVEHLRWFGAAVESHSARLRGRRRGIESIEPAVQFTFRSRPCQYFSLSSRRNIFPVAVRGKASMNSTLLGALKAATRSRAQRITSWGSGLLPGFG